MLDAPVEIVIGTIFLYDLLGMGIRSRSSIISEWFFLRRLLLYWTRCNMFIHSRELFFWESGHGCVTFIYVLEV